ncbi:MAG: MacB family efflux pump subunit [Alphaproteobacteria bacterium]|nr:MacB family efflux pump subunit [Alphaproteobacteria bacterium]
MNKPSTQIEPVVEAGPLIELTDIRKTFFSGTDVAVEVLHGISLTIYPGEFLAIMGASGSGKSTLMNIIGCLDRSTGGTYRFAGRDISEFDSDELAALRREAFGFIFQSYNLIGTASAVENVEVPAIYAGVRLEERRERAKALLTKLGLSDRFTHRPNQLSGGQQQRVSIARALMNGGQIILADEPTGALDSRSGAEVMALLRELADQGHTILLITHDRDVAAQARRIIEIKDGVVLSDSGVDPGAASDKARELAAQSPAGDAFWGDMGEAASMALRALRANLFRTILTLLGIVIGVGSVVAMLAIGEGAKQEVVKQIGSMGTNLLLVRPGQPHRRGVGGTVTTMVPADAEAMSSVPNVLAAVPELQGTITARFGDNDYQTQVDATWPDLTTVRSWPVAQGTFFSQDDERSYASVAVLGKTAYQQLFPGGEDPIGQYVLLKNVPFLVIGIMSEKGATAYGSDADDIIFVPLSTGSLRLFGQRYLRSITVAAKDVAAIDATQEALTELLKSRHGSEDFYIRNMASVVQTASEAQNTLTILLGSVAAISLLVGGIGVMNIMLVSVTERTREIGIRMATGARMRNILQQFLTEAVVVSALGGIIGVLGGIGVGLLIGAFGTAVEFTAPPIILAFGCAAATGLVFGFAPALKAARLDPVVALQSE